MRDRNENMGGKSEKNGKDWLLVSICITAKLSLSIQPYCSQMAHCKKKIGREKTCSSWRETPRKMLILLLYV
jgi:hypothetical protein